MILLDTIRGWAGAIRGFAGNVRPTHGCVRRVPLVSSQVLDVIEALFMHMFDGIATRCKRDLETIAAQYPFEPIVAKPTRITFAEGIKLLQENG